MAEKQKFGKKLKGLIGRLAPTIGTAIGGPFGSIAGGFVANALGVETEDQVVEILQTDPDALAKVKAAELAFEQHLSDNNVALEDIAAKDRDSARQLAIAKGIIPQIVLSAIYSTGYFYVVWLFLTGRVMFLSGQETLVAGLIGVLTAAQVQVINFWMGSSAGSKGKTDIMAAGGRTVS